MNKVYIEVILFLLMITGFLLYCITSIPQLHMYDLVTPFDMLIPLVPLFVIPYVSFHPFLIPATLIGLYRKNRTVLREFLVSAVILLFCSNSIFYFFPTQCTLRPEIEHVSWLYQLVQFVYKVDYPCALCPSVHVNISTLCALMWLRISSRGSTFMVVWSVFVVLSTLFIRQHYLVDVVAGIFSAYLAASGGRFLVHKYLKGDDLWRGKIIS